MQEKRHLIYEFSDYNMAGSGWTWRYYLEREEDGSFTLFAEQTIEDDDPVYEDEEPWELDPLEELRSAEDLLDAITYYGDEHIGEVDPSNFIAGITSFDSKLGAQFKRQLERVESDNQADDDGSAPSKMRYIENPNKDQVMRLYKAMDSGGMQVIRRPRHPLPKDQED
jgi:hypothetical protein